MFMFESILFQPVSWEDFDPVIFDTLKVKAEVFAQQITLIDLPVFKAITIEVSIF